MTLPFIFTVDTEADNQWQLRPGDKLTVKNLLHLPRFQALCEKYGIRPTYLCTYEMVTAKQFGETLVEYQRKGKAEIGAHLHPWTNPPFISGKSPVDFSEYPGYPSELNPHNFRRKLEVLTSEITRISSVAPISYRAGRYGFSSFQIPILIDLGYRVDCSITPYMSWRQHKGIQQYGPDFRRALSDPYYADFEDVCKPGTSRLLEIPLTTMPIHKRFDRLRILSSPALRNSACESIMAKLLGRQVRWARPSRKTKARQLIKLLEKCAQTGRHCFQMFIHSSELMPGGHPALPNQRSIDDIYETIEELFAYAQRQSILSMTLREYADHYSEHCSRAN